MSEIVHVRLFVGVVIVVVVDIIMFSWLQKWNSKLLSHRLWFRHNLTAVVILKKIQAVDREGKEQIHL